jgi:hypothetical protein
MIDCIKNWPIKTTPEGFWISEFRYAEMRKTHLMMRKMTFSLRLQRLIILLSTLFLESRVIVL